MATIAEMLVALGISTGPFTAGLAKAQGELRGFATEAETSGRRASGAFNAVGIAGLAVAGGVAVIGIESARSASVYQASMTTIGNAAHLTVTQSAAVGTAIEQTAIGTSSSANTMAAALAPVAGVLGRIEGGALSAAAATNVLTAAQNLTEAANVPLATSMKAVTDLLLTYHLRASDAATVSTALFEAQSQLGIPVETLGGILQKLQPRIAGSNLSLQQLLAIVRELEPVVGTGTRALTTVGTVVQSLVNPTSAATKALATVGLTLTDARGKFIGMTPALTAIREAFAKLPPTVAAGSKEVSQATILHALFGKQAQIGAALIAGGTPGIIANSVALAANGTAADAAGRVAGTLGDQEETLKATVETTGTAIGGVMVPALNQLFSAVLPVVTGVAQWATANPRLAATILAVTGGVAALVAAVVFLGPILGAIGGAIGVITSPILLVVGAITALAAHFGLLGEGARNAVDGIASSIAGAIPGVISMLQNLAAQFIAWVGPMIPQVIAALGSLASQAIAWVSAQAPIFLAQLLSWADVFVGWIGPMIPVALGALGDLGTSLVRWVLDEVPILAAGVAVMAGQLVNWVLPKIPGLLSDLAQFGYSLVNWILGEVGVVAGAMVQLANGAIGALVNALVADPSLIVKGIALMLGGVVVVAAAQAAAAVVGAAYTLAMKVAATLSSAMADFASAIAAAILTKLTTMAAAGGIVGTAIGAAMKVGALAAEGFGNIATAIAGVIGEGTPVVAGAAATQGTAAGAAGALSFGAALTLGMVAAAVAAVAAAWAIINDGLNKQVGAIQTRLNQVIQTQTLAQLTQDKLAIGKGIADIMSIPFGETLYGDQLKGLRAQLDQVDAQIAHAKMAAAAGQRVPSESSSRVPAPGLVAIPDKTLSLVAVPDYAENAAAAAAAAAAKAQAAAAKAAVVAAAQTTTVPGAAAIASAPVVAATSAAVQATTLAQIHLESMRVQLQTAELAANAGDAAAAQQVLVLKAEIAHQQAADAVAAAQRSVTVAEAAVEASHAKLVLAQEGKIKGLNIVATSEAAYKLAQDKLALATAKLTLAQGNAALQAQTAVTKAATVPVAGGPLGILEPAGGITGAGALPFVGTTTSADGGAGTGTSTAGMDWAALRVLADAIRAWMSNGVPLTLDGQTVGDLVSQHAYVSASMATSGFVAQGSIG